jgi:hypothetical protein
MSICLFGETKKNDKIMNRRSLEAKYSKIDR